MKKTIFALLLFLLSKDLQAAQIYNKTNQSTYTIKVTILKNAPDFLIENHKWLKVVLIGSIPSTNMYQKVENLIFSPPDDTVKGELIATSKSNNQYLRLESNYLLERYDMTFKYSTWDIEVDFSKINVIHEYVHTDFYNLYTQLNPNINSEEDFNSLFIKMQKESKNYLDFAKKSYLFLQRNYKHGEHNKHLRDIFITKKGDCSDLTELYSNLLRKYGIPTRTLSGYIIRKDNQIDRHVWLEFLLENYGWIPADPSWSLPNGKAFGKLYKGHVILQQEDYPIIINNGSKDVPFVFINGCSWWYWRSGGTKQGNLRYMYQLSVK